LSYPSTVVTGRVAYFQGREERKRKRRNGNTLTKRVEEVIRVEKKKPMKKKKGK